MDQLESRLLRLLNAKAGADQAIDLNTSLNAGTGLDSVAIMDVVFELEEEFDVTIPLDRIADVKTVAELANVVRELRAKAA